MMDNIEHTVNDSLFAGTIGARLRVERERLQLSQEAFANKAGVHRRTQVNYEADERRPDADYLAAIAGFGADIAYIVTGSRGLLVKQPWPDDAQIYVSLIDAIRAELGICKKDYDPDWQWLFDLLKADWADFVKGADSSRGIGWHCRSLLSKSPYVEFNADRLADLLERIEFVAESEGRVLSARDKASAVMALRAEGAPAASPPPLVAVKAVLQRLGA
ncbi:MAG: helix-turn-helix transcriptional regulator [Dechloromonas sp.]|jgi:transcriptional regulator with XRE-family HTH domain|nr:helix-turn-helix transcriptional regulator [Dechloromonas sp.]